MTAIEKRALIFLKYCGHCAFCGCDLQKGWHTWDIEPIAKAVTPSGELKTINDEIENLMPACKSCDGLRHRPSMFRDNPMNIEEFRKSVLESFEFLKGGGITASSYGRAIRFGFIVETGKRLEFYFEKYQREKVANN